MSLTLDDAEFFSAPKPDVTKQRQKVAGNLDSILDAEGALHLKPVVEAIYGQESGGGKNSSTSTDGARGGMQIMPGTFKTLAKDGELIDNPDDNMRVGVRLIKQLGDKFGNDPARIAAGYFSGEGNVNPAGDLAYKKDHADGNGKRVSAYVQDVLGRLVPSAQAGEVKWPGVVSGNQSAGDGIKWPGLIAEAEAIKPAPVAKEEPKSNPLLDELKRITGWRSGEKLTRPDGMTDATFSAGIPEGQAEFEAQLKKQPNSMVAGYQTDGDAPSKKVIGMTEAGEAKMRGMLNSLPTERLMARAEEGGLAGQIASQILATRADYQAKLSNNQVPTAAEDIQAGVNPKRWNQDRQQEANQEYLKRNKGAVMDYLTKAQRLTPEDAQIEYDRMLQNGVVSNRAGMDNTRQEAGYGDVLGVGAERAKAKLGRGYMGAGEWLGDVFGIDALSSLGANGAAMYEKDDKQSADAVIGLIPKDGLKALVAETAPSIISQIPGVVGAGLATLITKNPAAIEGLLSTALLTPMGVQTFGESYRDGKSAGLSTADNTVYSFGKAVAEVLPEKISLGALFKFFGGVNAGTAKAMAGAFLNQQVTEHATEQVTTVAQFLLDQAYINPDLSLKDLQKQMVDTFKATALQAPILAGIGAGTVATGKGAMALRDQLDPTGAAFRQLNRNVENAQWDQGQIDAEARHALSGTVGQGDRPIQTDAEVFGPARKSGVPVPATTQPGQQPAAVANEPEEEILANATGSNPIANELAQIEGVSNDQTAAVEGSNPGNGPAPGGQEGAQTTGQPEGTGQAREGGVTEGTEAGRGLIAGTPIEKHSQLSLSFLMAAHPDQFVRQQAAEAIAQKQREASVYSVVTQTAAGPVQSVIDNSLKGKISDGAIQGLQRSQVGQTLRLTTPEAVRVFHVAGAGAHSEVGAVGFSELIKGISGRNVIVAQNANLRGVVVDGRNIILSQQQGAEGLTTVAFHELRHALVEDHPDLSAFWSDAVRQHMDTSDSALVHFLTHTYEDPAFTPERVAELKAKGRTDSQILNALLAKHTQARAYEDAGRGSKRDWVLEELEADALGDATNRNGVIQKALDYMAKVDIGAVQQFSKFLKDILAKIDKALGAGQKSERYIKGNDVGEDIRARIAALDKAAAEVLGRYASRTQNQKRMQTATVPELLMIKKAHPDEVVRDMAEARLKQLETEEAYKQNEQKKEADKQAVVKGQQQEKLDQAEAEAKAAGTDDGTLNSMQAALAGAKKDIQSLRKQLKAEMAKAATAARNQAKTRQATLEDNEAGRFSPIRGANQTLPTRWPSSKLATPSVNDPMLADLETLKQTPDLLEKAVNALAEEPGLRTKARKVESKLEDILGKMVSNLLWLHDQVPAEIRQRSKLWYDGANVIANKWAEQYDKTPSQAAGILAVLSPQKDWFMNVTMAERILDVLSTQMDHKFDAKMKGAAFKFLVKEWSKDPEARTNMQAFEAVKDKTLREVVEGGDLRAAGIWLRSYDEAYHDPRHAVIHPEGDFGDNARTVTGTETLRAWGDFSALGKAASIFLDGSAENINEKLGGEHKVRNFYNNIFAPKDNRFATIDTHAVAADLVRPLAGADKPVADNFGKSGGSAITGVSGTYPIHFEAYKRAAEARGVLPREMQSITWEAVRGLFTEGFKGKKDNLKMIDQIWKQVDSGKLTTDEARQQILEKAGGIQHPDWWDGKEPSLSENTKSYSQQRPTFNGNRISFEVAPDPTNKELTARWNALPAEAKAQISYDIAWDTAGKVLGFYNSDTIKGELHTQTGGYLEDTNPSFSLWMNKYASMVKVQEITNTLGYVLQQESMIIGSPTKFKGGTEMGVVLVTNVSDTNSKTVYDELRKAIRAEDGSALINGHTTSDGNMAILVPVGTEDAIHQRVVEQLGDRHDVGHTTTFVQWPERGENEYGFTGQDQAGGSSAESPIRAYAHQLRAQATGELERRISAAESGGRFSPIRSNAGSRGLGSAGERSPGRTGSTIAGTHFSNEERPVLDGRKFGSGTKSAEAERLARATDSRIKARIYAYVDEGHGIIPEQGVGHIPHAVTFDNLYDRGADKEGFFRDAYRGNTDNGLAANEAESKLLDAGYSGYYLPKASEGSTRHQGVAILLGDATHSFKPDQVNGKSPEQVMARPAARAGDAVRQNRLLPGGRMTGAEWKRLMPAVAPAVDVSGLQDDKGYYKDDVAQALDTGRFSPIRTKEAQAVIDTIEGRLAKVHDKGRAMVERHLDNLKRGLAGEVVRDEQGNLLAPNGRKSKLDEKQYMQVRSPEFIAWFGDWLSFHNAKDGNGVWHDDAQAVSKVVDENGEPAVAYHGAERGGFTKLDPSKADSHRSPMIFAAASRETSRSYSGRGDEIDMGGVEVKSWEGEFGLFDRDSELPYRIFKTRKEAERALELAQPEQRGIYSIFLNIRNPQEAYFEGANWDGQAPPNAYEVFDGTGDQVYGPNGERYFSQDQAEELAEENNGDFRDATSHYETTNSVAEEALKYGNDGAIIRDVVDDGGKGMPIDPDTVFVIFNSNQAKSATQNTGAFSKTNDDLRYSPIRRAIARVDAAVDGLSNLPNQFDYLADRYRTLGKISRGDEIVKEIRSTLNKATGQDKVAVYTYLTTPGATTNAITDPAIRDVAKRIKDTINYVGDQLVARGLLDPATRAKYKDQYLPRMYLKHVMDEGEWKLFGAGKKPSDMGYLKERKDIDPEVRELILGEIKDPAFLSANAIGRAVRDMSILDWLGRISTNGDWVYPKSFVNYRGQRVTSYWLKGEADRIEHQIPHYAPAAQARAKALVDSMRQAAASVEPKPLDHTVYRQIPDTHRYGLLRGMWIRKEIYNDVMGMSMMSRPETVFEDWLGFNGKGAKLTQMWKFMKVAANPPGQIRNFVSNMVMLQLSGVGLHKLPIRLAQAAHNIVSDGKYWKVAKKFGVMESTFTAQELYRAKESLMSIQGQTRSINPVTWLMAAGGKLLNAVGDLYQFTEALCKTVKIIDEMEKGKSEAEAAIEAQKWLFDYSLVPHSVRVARNAPVGMPFITYQVKVLPRLLEVATTAPWRLLPWVSLLYGMEQYVAGLFGVDDDELRKLKKSLPEWLQDRGHTMFMPYKDEEGRVQVADLGYFFPWSFYTQVGQHAAEGKIHKALVDDIGGQMSAPILGGIAALGSNYNTFTKKPLYNESDPVSYQAAAISNYVYDLMAPPFLSSHGFASPMGLVDKQYGGKMVQAVTGTTNKFGDPRATETQALAGLFGFNFYGMDPEHTRITNLQVQAAKVTEAEKQLKYRLMDRGLTDQERAKYLADYGTRMRELAEETRKYADESKVPEQLKAKK